MLKKFLGTALAMALLCAGPVLADESGKLPVACILKANFNQHQVPSFPVWTGVNSSGSGKYVVFERVEDGAWYEVLFTVNGLACVIDGGPDHQLIGDEADAS